MKCMRRCQGGLPIFIGLTVLLVGLTGLDGCSDKPPHQPNIVLIVLDTVRADHMSCYGYEWNTTPVMTELATTATLYTRARATSPWTLPSHASLFTGLYPHEHGAHTVWIGLPGGTGPEVPLAIHKGLIDNVRPLQPGRPTLAEVLARAGYRTAAIGANTAYLDTRFGLARGFETYDMQRTLHGGLNRRVAAWLDRDDQRPFFLFLNYMDAHTPYNNAPVPGLLDRDPPPNTGTFMDKLYAHVLSPSSLVPERALATLTDQYDLGIANLDIGIGHLIKLFRTRGLYDDLLLIITSDHGEYLGEHQLIEHSKDVYEPVMNVPLLVKTPRQRHGVVDDTPISLVHVAPLILRHVAGADTSPFPHDEPGGDLLAENHFTRLKDLFKPWGPRFYRERYVIYRGNLKLIRSSDGNDELFDLGDDPEELRNLIAVFPDTAAALVAALGRRLERESYDLPDLEPHKLTDEEKRRLKALGYL